MGSLLSRPSRFASRCLALASVAGVSIGCETTEDLGASTSELDGRCTVPPVAPVLVYPLDIDPETTLSLETARGLHAIVDGELPTISDVGSPLGPALALGGATAFRTTDDAILDAPKGAFTVASWVTADSLVGTHTIASRGVDGASGSWRLAVVASADGGPGDVIFRLCGFDGCGEARLPKALPVGEPHHVAVGVQLAPHMGGSISEVILRVAPIPGGDRAPLEGRSRLELALRSFDSDAPLLIGATDAASADGVPAATDHFVGVLDQLLVFAQSLSPTELAVIEGGIDGGGICAPEPLPPPPLPFPPSVSCTVAGPTLLELRGGHTGVDHTVTFGSTLTNCPNCTVSMVTRGSKVSPNTGSTMYGSGVSFSGAGPHSVQGTQHYADWRSIGLWDVTVTATVFQTVNGRSTFVTTCQDTFRMRVTDTVPAGTWCNRSSVDWQDDVDNLRVVMDDRSTTIAPQVFTGWGYERNLLLGGAGGDTITGHWDVDCIIGAGGADTLRGDLSSDSIYGGEGNDLIEGDDGFDRLYGGPGQDTIKGGDESDTISGGADADTIDAGTGDDDVHGDDGNDLIRGAGGRDELWGDAGNDSLYGESGGDTLHGGANDDFLDGGANDDWIYGDDGNDTLRGGANNDHLYCGPGRDKAKGEGGTDVMEGGTGNDFLKGDDGDDSLDGEDGIDRLCSGTGADTIDGGADTDSCRGTPQANCEVTASFGSCTDNAWNNY